MEPGLLGSRDRPHVCPYCDRGFRKLEHLRRHTRIHTKEKPYVCHCGSSFSRRDLLRRHDRLSHPNPEPARITTEESEAAPDVETHPVPEFQTDPERLQGNTTGGNTIVAEPSPASLPLPPEYYDQRKLKSAREQS
ncbi:hypothetical protein NW762_008998 [Fusarium torreyae]|uniref:C2H2-type domain-containing protein n=1 Tax=Fusarium torreyae TaxID=1237075 RepID=A0A9W8RXM3_9HYPO|nr:hypothetical protein NW762_008998 [Fusarium torreyae]